MDPKFARDFGYLDKFFVNLTAHADTLPPAAGQRLKQLMAEEVLRWNEVRSLLSGGAAVPSAPSATSPVPAAAAAPEAPAPAPKPSNTLTVGSLMGQPKK